jgi:hypothetical protein
MTVSVYFYMYACVADRGVTVSLVERRGVIYYNTRANINCLIIDRFVNSAGAKLRCGWPPFFATDPVLQSPTTHNPQVTTYSPQPTAHDP